MAFSANFCCCNFVQDAYECLASHHFYELVNHLFRSCYFASLRHLAVVSYIDKHRAITNNHTIELLKCAVSLLYSFVLLFVMLFEIYLRQFLCFVYGYMTTQLFIAFITFWGITFVMLWYSGVLRRRLGVTSRLLVSYLVVNIAQVIPRIWIGILTFNSPLFLSLLQNMSISWFVVLILTANC